MTDGILSARLTNVVLPAADLDASAEFYGTLFGFEPFHRDATSVFLRTGGSHLVFVLMPGKNESVCLDLSVPNVAEASAALTSANIPFEGAGSQVLTLRDPDGNLIEIVQG